MKTTPFTKYHIENGARMAEFAGFNMPIEFSGINDEHHTVREKAGVFDVSHMGEIWVKGPRAIDFLQHVTSNNVATLYDGKIQYSCLPNGRGGIVDDILVYRIDAETFLLVVNASNTEKDWKHLCKEGEAFGLTPGKELYNASDEIAQLAVQGPLAMQIVQRLCPNADVEHLEYYTFIKTEVAGIQDAIVSATGYTGSGGCEIYVANEDADRLWTALWKAGAELGLKNIGLGARDTLPLRQRHRRHHLADRSRTGLDHQIRRRQGFYRPGGQCKDQGRGAETASGRLRTDRAGDSAPRLQTRRQRRRHHRRGDFRDDVALPEKRHRDGLCSRFPRRSGLRNQRNHP